MYTYMSCHVMLSCSYLLIHVSLKAEWDNQLVLPIPLQYGFRTVCVHGETCTGSQTQVFLGRFCRLVIVAGRQCVGI